MLEGLYTIFWLFLIETIGIITLPITIFFFRNLKDRGYSVSKLLGLILLAFFAYVLGQTGIKPILISFVSLSAILMSSGVFLFRPESSEIILKTIRSKEFKKVVIITELIFLLSFFAILFVRSFRPDIDSGEARMDFSYVNSLTRRYKFPLVYPWFYGAKLEQVYYYFGHFLVAVLTNISGIPSSITYNLSFCLFPTLLIVSAFGMGYNLTKKTSFGFFFSFLIIFLANIFAVMHILNVLFPNLSFYTIDYKPPIHGSFFDRLIAGGDSDVYWWSVRIIPSTITETPWFQFLWGDLHAHFVSYPFIVLFLMMILTIFNSGKSGFLIFGDTKFEAIAKIFILSVSLGFFFPQFVWNYPVLVVAYALAVLMQNFTTMEKMRLKSMMSTFLSILVIIGLSLVLYFPIFFKIISFNVDKNPVSFERMKTTTYHLIILLLPFFVLSFYFLIEKLRKISIIRKNNINRFLFKLSILLYFFLIFSHILNFFSRPNEFNTEVKLSSLMDFVTNFQTLSFLLPVILSCIAIVIFTRKNLTEEKKFVILLIFMVSALPILWDTITVYGRYVFIFKMFTSLWIFACIVCGYVFFEFVTKFNKKSVFSIFFLIFIVLLLILSSFPYFILSLYKQTGGFKRSYGRQDWTIDGASYLELTHNTDFNAINWINSNIEGTPVILETPGPEYTYYARISTFTGLPTVVGWRGHSEQVTHNDTYSLFLDVNTAYNTTDDHEALEILKKYDVRYIYIGELEKQSYSQEGLNKFSENHDYYTLVYDQLGGKIYYVKKYE